MKVSRQQQASKLHTSIQSPPRNVYALTRTSIRLRKLLG
ncbi:hypothetical protein LMG27177_00305 [Paraburkholderia fynbosensis]|uniref:Uncharacterized protein n=1 Tax=Paraburkholderia fynbosensis TaxID=1200993 RepID=A0A6J5FFC0_9BURK|nr:hypothetical protein LMG27177_00305 [Paraburkholderia fynbosensis]